MKIKFMYFLPMLYLGISLMIYILGDVVHISFLQETCRPLYAPSSNPIPVPQPYFGNCTNPWSNIIAFLSSPGYFISLLVGIILMLFSTGCTAVINNCSKLNEVLNSTWFIYGLVGIGSLVFYC
jgi:hypothetical protein